MNSPTDNNGKFEIPDWFQARNAVQEHIVEQERMKDQALEAMVHNRVQNSKRNALPKATEYVRELYSRSKCMRRGKCQVWTSDTWARVQRNSLRRSHPVRYYVQVCVQYIGAFFPRMSR